MYLSVIAAIITISINIIFIPRIGYMASAWATLIAYGFIMTASFFIGRNHFPVPYPVKKILIYILLGILLSGISFIYFRGNYLISFIILILFLSYTFFNEKNELQNIFKK